MDNKLIKAFRALGQSVNVKAGSVDFSVNEGSQETYALYFESGNTVRWEHYMDWNQKEPESTGEFTVAKQDVISISRAFLADVLKVNVDSNIKNLVSKVRDSKNPLQGQGGDYLYNINSEGNGFVASKFPGQLLELWKNHGGSPINYYVVQPLLIEAFFNEGMLFHVNMDPNTRRNPYNSFEWNPTFAYKTLNDALMGKIGTPLDNGGDYSKKTNENVQLVATSFDQFVNETKTVTLKRQYTDQHPAMTAGLHAKIRNKVLEAIADGILNQEELMKIVSEHSTNAKRWFTTNKKYFTVSEDGGISLSSFGKKILDSIIVHEGNKFTGAAKKAKQEGLTEFEFNGKTFPVTVKDKTIIKEEEKMNESKEEKEAKAILQDLLAEYDPWELKDMLPEEAQDTVESYGHKGTQAKKIAEILCDLATSGTFESKKTFLYESFSEFISSTKPVNEAFKSTRLSNLFATAGNQAKELSKAFYNSTRLQLDQIEDFDLIEVSPDAAYKAKGGSKFVFYISDVEKENPYAPSDSYRNNKMVPGGGYLLAVTDAENTFYGTAWARGLGNAPGTRTFKKIDGKPGNDSIGIGKVYRGYDATGLYNAKRISEVADRAIILDIDILKQRYSAESVRGARAEAKKGATVFMNDKEFKDANIARYNKILSQKAMELPLDKIVLDTIDTLSSHIKDAVAKNLKTQYGEILIGKDKKDRDIKLSDAANVMRNLLDDYSRYVSALSASIESEKRYGSSDTYYKREALNYAKTIQDRVRKIENMDYAW